jgi:phage gp29-like protein
LNRKSKIPLNEKSKISFERIKGERLSRFNPIRGLTAEILASRIDYFEAGYLGPFARLMAAIKRRDDVMKTVAPKREKAPGRRKWEILIDSSIPEAQQAEAQKHKEALEYFYNNLTATDALDLNQRGGVRLLVRQIMQAVGYKYAVHHIVWKQTPDGITAELIYCPLWFFENRTGKLRYLKDEFAFDGEEMLEGEWMVAVEQDYLMEACAVAYIYKSLPLKDWLIFSQDYAKPVVEGITDAPEGSKEWNTLKAAVDALAADLRLVRSRSAEIKLTELSASANHPHPPLVERMDRALASIWRGADLSTISAGSGDGSGASLQGDEKDLLEEDDASFASETCNDSLDTKVIEYTFGPGTKPLAYFKIIVPPKKDITQEIATDTFLRDSGAPLGMKATLERYGRQLPDA